jgi:hypothetical protein
MHDPVDIRRCIERLVARVQRRDDYNDLLSRTVPLAVELHSARIPRPGEGRGECRNHAKANAGIGAPGDLRRP